MPAISIRNFGGLPMTDQAMCEKWADLLRPLFPAQAGFTFKPRRRLICVSWSEDGDDTGHDRHSVAIAFTQLAWRGYRGGRNARRTRADLNLECLVRVVLAQDGADAEWPSGEMRIDVSSIDLFPPPSGAGSRTVEGR